MKITIKATEPQAQFHALPHKYRAFVAGFGTGKTQTLIDAAILDAMQCGSGLIGIYEPTYSLMSSVIVPRLLGKLDESGIRYKHNKQLNYVSVSTPNFGDFILRTLDTPDRIVGYETYTSHIDELDTLRRDHAEHAFNQILGRNRQVLKTSNPQKNRINVYTTPEGFKFVYERWALDPRPDYGMVQASTYTNPFLPDDYIDQMRQNYTPELFNAYAHGQFVNLVSGSVYTSFDKELNNCTTTITDSDTTLHIGMDFNVGNMSGVVLVQRGDEYHAVDELVKILDTKSMIEEIKARYPSKTILVYPDASGNSRSTSGSDTDFILLRQAGFSVYADKVNPRVKDRINTVNAALLNSNLVRRLKINGTTCKTVTTNLIQQAWKNGEPDKTKGNDHTNDALGYVVMKLLGLNTHTIRNIMRF